MPLDMFDTIRTDHRQHVWLSGKDLAAQKLMLFWGKVDHRFTLLSLEEARAAPDTQNQARAAKWFDWNVFARLHEREWKPDMMLDGTDRGAELPAKRKKPWGLSALSYIRTGNPDLRHRFGLANGIVTPRQAPGGSAWRKCGMPSRRE
jgi:hypothetical protein